jgi:hypothetical protein
MAQYHIVVLPPARQQAVARPCPQTLRELCKVRECESVNALNRKFLLYGHSDRKYTEDDLFPVAVEWEFVKTTESVCLRRRAHRLERFHQPSKVKTH